MKKLLSICYCAAALAFFHGSGAQAGIVGFGGNGTGWTVNQHGSAPPVISGDVLTITTAQASEANSAFSNTPQPINQDFAVSFTWNVAAGNPPADGFTFTIQNQGLAAVGNNAYGGALGYAGAWNGQNYNGPGGIAPSVAIGIANYPGSSSLGVSLGVNGAFVVYSGAGSIAFAAVNAPVQCTITYTAATATLAARFVQGGNSLNVSYNVNIPQTVGGATALVGFTGATGSAASTQQISNFQFVSAPQSITGGVSAITTTGATVSGTVTPNGGNTGATFEYGTSAAYGASVAATPGTVSGSNPATAVAATLSGLLPHKLYHYRLDAANTVATSYGADATFTTANTSPTAGTSTASINTGNTVTITLPFATTDADGDTVTVPSISASSGAPFTLGTVSGNTVPVTGKLNAAGTGTINFTVTDGFGGTANGSVTVTVLDNIAPTFTSVPSNMTVTALSGAAGTGVNYPAATATDNVGVTSLTANVASGSTFPLGQTTVTFTASDAAGNSTAASFTVTVVEAPAVATGAASVTGGSGATLAGTVTANGLDSTAVFEYGTSTAYGATIAAVPGTVSAGSSGAAVGTTLTSLLPHTLYHYRLDATNSAGTTYGNDATFTTRTSRRRLGLRRPV